MKLLEIIKRMARAFNKERCEYCLIGGHAASLYRSRERFTRDVDFALVAKPARASQKIALKAIESIGLKPVLGFIPAGKNEHTRKSIRLVTSAPAKGSTTGIVDILLPELPWIPEAVKRAQYNLVDLGFAEVPVITPEDLILAKSYALHNSPDRFQDLDDLKEIMTNIKDLDFDYVRERLRVLQLKIPAAVRKYYRGGKI